MLQAQNGAGASNDAVGVLNPNTHNLTVLPLHDWRLLIENAPLCSVSSSPSGARFLHVSGTKYLFEDVFRELRSCSVSDISARKLPSCECCSGCRPGLQLDEPMLQMSHDSSVSTLFPNVGACAYAYRSGSCSSDSGSEALAHSQAENCEGTSQEPLASCTCRGSSDEFSTPDDSTWNGVNGHPLTSASTSAGVASIELHPGVDAEGTGASMDKKVRNRRSNRYNSDDLGGGTRATSDTDSVGTSTVHFETADREECVSEYPLDHSSSLPSPAVHRSHSPAVTRDYARTFSCRNAGDPELLCNISEVDCLAAYDPNHEDAIRDVLFFDNVMCCGTFDCLHFGHKYLLLSAFLSCRSSMQIGITASDALLSKKRDFSLIQSLEKRREAVESYMRVLRYLYGSRRMVSSPLLDHFANGSRVMSYHNCDFFAYPFTPVMLPDCGELSYREYYADGTPHQSQSADGADALRPSVTTFELMDIYGPAAVLEETFALVISPESLPGAEKVNDLRRSKGLSVWPLLSSGFVLHPELDCTRKKVHKVSSSRIRSCMRPST
ncbi:pantetheine-phosphate adenylyltransferase [Babesia ovata]|uniref:Pantetheine-phosphate adenylyltransferase n=1 Tax=Babesia ovata TaxID=189622 RepID=A0A2H6K8W0_9APIC|nr:pantetheine-phosphate adenylyltransferase [Babesia ovata]GBE59420.1 pantetheine-phosphate adenylyltransferase [Babesia ovata]